MRGDGCAHTFVPRKENALAGKGRDENSKRSRSELPVMLVPQRAAHPLGGSSSSLGAPGRGHTDHRAGDVAAGARSSQAPEAARPAGP